MCCRVAHRPLLLPTDAARAHRAFSLRPPPLASLSSCLPERLSFLHDVVGPSPSQKDLGCSGRLRPGASLASGRPPWRCASADRCPPIGRWLERAPGTPLPSGSFRSGGGPLGLART